MPCCHVGPTRPFHSQFKADAQRFSAYVGGSPATFPAGSSGAELVSALHIDLKLWQPKRPLGRPYRINDAFGNSWKAARPQLSPNPFIKSPKDRKFIEDTLVALPKPPTGCVISTFDQWILDTIWRIRGHALSLSGAPVTRHPSALSTVGMAQKVVNLFLKYQACWLSGGQWNPTMGKFNPYPESAVVAPFLCALHSPIDSILLKRILHLPIGKWLVQEGLMDSRGYLRQSNGAFTSWSNLNCLRTYFGFQWMLRCIAIRTWPNKCACPAIGNHQPTLDGKECDLPPLSKNDQKWDWIRKVANLPPAACNNPVLKK
jgi:hypothetical protein